MKRAALAGVLAAVVGALVLAFQPFASSPPGSSADRTVYSFVYSLKHHNFGRACSYIAQKQRGPSGACAQGLAYNEGVNMAFFGIDLFDGMYVVRHSRHENPDGTVTYAVASPAIPATHVTVAKQDNGRWRIVKIGD